MFYTPLSWKWQRHKSVSHCHTSPLIWPLGHPPRSGEAGRGVWDALRGDVGSWRHQRGTRLHWADQRHLRPGAVWWHHHPGGLGGREEWVCPQRSSLLRGGDEERPALSMLIWEAFRLLRGKRRRIPEGLIGKWLTDCGVGPETVGDPLDLSSDWMQQNSNEKPVRKQRRAPPEEGV